MSEAADGMIAITVTSGDISAVEGDEERFYVTGTAPSGGQVRVWMGPESYRSLLDAVRNDGVVWCTVPQEQVVRPVLQTSGTPADPNALTANDLSGDDSVDESDSLEGPVEKPGSLVGTVVLVDVGDGNDERLYVIPESWARSQLRSYATLCFARSYRDVLVDDSAVQTVVEALERSSLEDLDEDSDEDQDEDIDGRELFVRRVAADGAFDAEEFFGSEGWRQWTPGGAESTAQFLEARAPALWNRFKQPDSGWGIDYDPVDYLAPADEEQILAGLRALGCKIVRCPGLAGLYWGPAPDLVARIDAGEWPPTR